MKLATQMAGVLAIATIIGIGMHAGVTVYQAAEGVEQADSDRVETAAQRSAAGLGRDLDALRARLVLRTATLNESWLRPDPKPVSLQSHFTPLITEAGFEAIIIVDRGETTYAFPVGATADPPIVEQATLVLDGGRAQWIAPVLQFSEPPMVVGMIRPQVLSDRILEAREDHLRTSDRGAWGEVAVVDGDGRILASTAVGATSLDDLEGIYENPVTAEASVGITGIEVHVFGSRQNANQLRVSLAITGAATAGVLAMGSVGIGALLARQVTKPVKDIARGAERMARDLKTRVDAKGSEEIRALATALNHLATDLQRDRGQLLRLKADLEDQVDLRTKQLRHRQTEMEQFFYGVSHDIKGPIIGINTLLQLLDESLQAKGASDARQPIMVSHARQTAKSLEQLIMDLLAFARVDALKAEAEQIGLLELAREVITSAKGAAQDKDIQLVGPKRQVTAFLDPGHVTRILQNLVRNAIVHMPDQKGAKVQVRLEKQGSDVLIAVEDNGAGIPQEVQPTLFSPFARGRTSGTKGSGLGLSIVRRLVEQSGGKVWFETRIGKGTTFYASFRGAAR